MLLVVAVAVVMAAVAAASVRFLGDLGTMSSVRNASRVFSSNSILALFHLLRIAAKFRREPDEKRLRAM